MSPTLVWCLIMTAANLLVAVMMGFANPITTYQAGSAWAGLQLISTHFTHLDAPHLLSNLTALFILNALFPQPVRTLFWAYVCCVALTACYVTFSDIKSFLGFSALLYCHPGAYLIMAVKQRHWTQVLVIWVVLISYLSLQEISNQANHLAWQSMIMAHLIGFFGGTLAAISHQKYHAAIDIDTETTPPVQPHPDQHPAVDAVRPVDQR